MAMTTNEQRAILAAWNKAVAMFRAATADQQNPYDDDRYKSANIEWFRATLLAYPACVVIKGPGLTAWGY